MKKLLLSLLLLCVPLAAQADKPAPYKPDVTLYYSTHCGHCLRLKKEFLPKILERYGARVNWQELQTDTPDNLSRLWVVTRSYRGREATAAVPAIEVGGALLVGGEIQAHLEEALEQALSGASSGFDVQFAPDYLKKEFNSFSPAAIIAGGLIDGINPCAFAVIVFFISFLAVYGYRKAEIVVVGSAYCAGVFVAYMLIGLGILKALYALGGFYLAMKIFYYLMSGACFVFAALSVRDYYLYKTTGRSEGFALQLPPSFKVKINRVMGLLRKRDGSMGMGRLFLAAFAVGVLVSVIEAVCTGQVYVPTIAYILKDPQLRVKAMSYLFLYNLMFIVPLVAVFGLSLAGCSSERVSGFFKQRLGLSKLLLASLFTLLGTLLLALA